MSRWPRFELVTFPEPTDFPRQLAAPLLERGAPKKLLVQGYRAEDRLTLLDAPPYGQFVQFAKIGYSYSMCLDPRTGQVVVIFSVPGGSPSLVNSSLEQFIESARFVIGRFPFDGGDGAAGNDIDIDSLYDKWQTIADELAEPLRQIDPVAFADENGYWRTFLDDVAIGDYSTSDVVGKGDG